MNTGGIITPTQYKSAFDSKGNLTAEAKNDIKDIMYQSIFEGGSTQLKEMFNALPAKAQKAILATAYRDYDSPKSERMIDEIQSSIMAYYALSHDTQFMNAKNHKEARIAVEYWKRQLAFDDVTGESYLPSEKYNNFALALAIMYKGDTQSLIQSTFNKIYDLIQGTQEENLFEHPDNTPRSLIQAIKETLNIVYNGQQRNDVLAGNNATSQQGQQGGNGDVAAGGRSENRNGNDTYKEGTGTEIETGQIDDSEPKPIDYGDFGAIYNNFKGKAKEAVKFLLGKHNGEAVSALYHNDIGYIDLVWGKEGTNKSDGFGLAKLAKYHPEVLYNLQELLDDMLVIKRTDNRVQLESDKYQASVRLTWNSKKKTWLLTMFEKKNSAPNNNTDTGKTHKGNGNDTATPESTVISANKDKQTSDTKQVKEEKKLQTEQKKDEDLFSYAERVAKEDQSRRTRKEEEAKVDTNPTDKQKEAGNYKKGHIKIDSFDITIEQPKGSIRRGKDANGKEWESIMHNTYGYIRGTESVDGDHIDVFLSDNTDNGNVFVIDQVNKDGSFDEHKVMYGFVDMEDAKSAYLSNYEDGWQGLGNITEVSKEDFKKWINSSKRKTKPFAEYSSVKAKGGVQVEHPIESHKEKTEKNENRLVTEDRYEELKKRMRAKLGQLNMGVDPEMLSIGTEMAIYHIEKGARTFGEYAKKMIADLGDVIRPYLKAFYNGARDLPEMEELSKEMTSYAEVSSFNVATIGINGDDVEPTIFETAEQVSNEATVEQNTQTEAKRTIETSSVDNDTYSITKQHNNKKGIDIWVVRGKERTDKDVYSKRKQIAKDNNGYYSSFRGVNGFVFNTPEDAQAFANDAFRTQKAENYSQKSEEIIPDNQNGETKTEKIKENQQNISTEKKKTISSHSEDNLFTGLFNESEPKLQDNEDNQRTRTENRQRDNEVLQRQSSGTGTAVKRQLDGDIQNGRNDRQGDRRVSAGDETVLSSVERPSGRLSRLNTTNNHAERGVDYAPTSVDARIDANIKAIELANELVESGEKATPEQMAVLRKFSGWGGLGKGKMYFL